MTADWLELRPMSALRPADLHALSARAFNRADLEAVAALYEVDAVLVVADPEVVGRDRSRAAFEPLVAGRGRITITTRSVVESQVGLAVLHGEWAVERATDAGTRGLSTEVVRKQSDGTWLFVIDSPYAPAAPPVTIRRASCRSAAGASCDGEL